MLAFRSFFSALLHCFACLWFAIRNTFTRSKKPNPDHESGPGGVLDIEAKEPLEFFLEEYTAANALARSTDPFLVHEKPAPPPKTRPPPARRQLAVLEAIKRDGSLPYDENAEIRRNGIYFGPPSVIDEGLDALPFRGVRDFLDESYSVDSSSTPESPHSVDLTEQHTSHRESVATNTSVSRPSESDGASVYEDVTDEFVPYGPAIQEPPTSTALPDWRQADESHWKTEVALGLSKLKESHPEHDDISSVSSNRKSDTKRRSQSSQIKEICEWRNDLGEQPRVITPPLRTAEYKLAQTFQFPRSRSSIP
ncbi:hypothetical protein D9619_008753 [Psilocybe cf. subviscida]|uniref:Uncharacterized protein n=1 Tax=Psilocybe cf. subviscida TaxID=2480587 RepID=A0A8H5B9Y5_9AGAR|nr:hypothetical protein D9619_008753 [Psilocybe cf. subviscida]